VKGKIIMISQHRCEFGLTFFDLDRIHFGTGPEKKHEISGCD
jgi:hypothetical protein